jgi:hypothetical protein
MLKRILHRLAAKMERAYDYDNTYMHEMIDVSTGAALRFSALPLMSQYRGDAPAELWAGAALASSLDGDCGPCAQLTVDYALEAGVRPELLRACLRRDFEAAGLTGLGFRFAEAAIADDLAAHELRDEIEQNFGKSAVLAVAFATATSRAYPVLKRALGHGQACRQIALGAGPLEPVRKAA